MKTRIYLSILIILGMIGFNPIVSYASGVPVGAFWSSQNGSDVMRYVPTNDIVNDFNNPIVGLFIAKSNNPVSYRMVILGSKTGLLNNNYVDVYRNNVYQTRNSIGGQTLISERSLEYDGSTYYYAVFTFVGNDSFITGYPIIEVSDFTDASIKQGISDYFDIVNAPAAPLGHIIQIGYKYNPSKIFNESVTWDPEKSSTGYQYQSFDMVEFYAMDRSIKTLKNDIGALGGVSELVDWAERQLEKFVYPKGSNEYRIVSGRSGVSGSYGKMIHVLGVEADSGKAELAVINSMQNNRYDTDFQNYIRSQIGSLDKRSWYDKAYQWFTGNTYVYDVCYDIYCVIEDVNGNQGTWYKINFHDTPLPEREGRLNGGVTVTPVKPDRTIDPDSTDWQDVNFTEINEGDTNIDNSDNSVTTYITNNDGDDYYITNNYTYNYDNRSWIENHYTNEDVSEVDQGIEWLKLFPNFFGLFQKLFGAFLPGWASVVVTLAIPIVAGLLVFKIIKGVIPFV